MIKRILLVEDKYNVRQIVKEFLNFMNGYEIYEAENGQVAYELFGRVKPDLVISDLDMPVMDGYELVLKIKTVLCSDVPIIIMSAVSSKQRKQQIEILLEKGYIYYFLNKPIGLSDLAQVLAGLKK